MGAKESNLSQSAATQAIQSIEERLGVVLIDRTQRPWRLTNEGKMFYNRGKDILEEYQQLELEVKNTYDEASSLVRIASIYSVGLRHMDGYLKKFSELYPQAKINIKYIHPDKVYESVLSEETDMGIVSFPQIKKELQVIPWRSEVMVLACHPDHPLAKFKKVPFYHLSGEKFIAFDQGFIIRKEIDRFLKENRVQVNVVLEFDNIESIKQAVEIASGISILPRPTLDREVQTGLLAAVPLTTNEFFRPLGIIHRKGKKFNVNVQRFISLLREEKGEIQREQESGGNFR